MNIDETTLRAIPTISGSDVPPSEMMRHVEYELNDIIAMVTRRRQLTTSERDELLSLALIAGAASEQAEAVERIARTPTRREREGWTWTARFGWWLLQQGKERV